MLDENRIELRGLATIVGISKRCACHIAVKDLGMKKLTIHWLPDLFYSGPKTQTHSNRHFRGSIEAV